MGTPLPGLFQHGHACSLGLEAHVFRHLGLGPPLGIVTPLFRQIQPAVQEYVPFERCIAQKRAHLAVLDLARRAAVLAFHAHRARTLLDEARLVHHANAIFVREDLNDILLQDVAALSADHSVRTATVGRIGTVSPIFRQLPAVLTRYRPQQPTQVLRRLRPRSLRPNTSLKRRKSEEIRPIHPVLALSFALQRFGVATIIRRRLTV